MAKKPPLTPTLDMPSDALPPVEQTAAPATPVEQTAVTTQLTSEQTNDAISKLASGATLEEAATPAPAPAPVPLEQSANTEAPNPLIAHLTAQTLELSKQNQELSVKLALVERDLADATLRSTEHAELLSGLTTAACAAINLRQIQMGKSSTDLSHLTPQTALAEFNKVHNDFIKTFTPGQRSNSGAEVGQDSDLGKEKAPSREQVQNAQRLSKK